MGHQVMFRAIEDYDRGLFWLNSLFLMCIAFLPFPTSLLGEYGDQQLVVAIYAGSLAVARPLLIAAWRYATNRRRLVADDLDWGMIRAYRIRGLAVPLVLLISIVVSFFSVEGAIYPW